MSHVISPAHVRSRRLALGLFTVGAIALAVLTGCSDAADSPATTVAPVTTPLVATTVETNRCPDVDGVVTVDYGDDIDCDVVPPQRLDVKAWTDPTYGVMSPSEFADACSDMGGILVPIPGLNGVDSDFWLCQDVDY